MKNEKLKQNKGGLVLKRIDLESILNTSGTLGLAFGVDTPGMAPDVCLKVYRVYQGENELLGEEVEIAYKKGAAEAGGPISDCEDFTFQFLKKLRLNGFDFAYLRKSEFEELFETGNENGVFIAGALKKYGNVSTIEEDWFTLSIAPILIDELNLNESINPKSLNNPPRFKLMDGCPPIWDALAPDGDEGRDQNVIKFRDRVVIEN